MDETILWKEAAKYLWTVVAAFGAWLFNKTDNRIKTLEDAMYSKTAAKERREEIDKILEDRRQDVIALHAKIDGETKSLRSDISTLARDMNHGFSEIKTLLIDMKK